MPSRTQRPDSRSGAACPGIIPFLLVSAAASWSRTLGERPPSRKWIHRPSSTTLVGSLLIVVALACSCQARLEPTLVPDDPSRSFACTFEAKSQFLADNPVNITFSLRNVSSRTLHVLTWYTPLEGVAGEIFSVTRDGQHVPYQGMLAKRGDPSREDYVAIEAGEAVSAVVNLTAAYDLSTVGEYSVTFTSQIQDVVEDEGSVPRRREAHLPEELLCNEVSFAIVRRLD